MKYKRKETWDTLEDNPIPLTQNTKRQERQGQRV
jgi:hypothetical protein